ncbi:signal peptidase I [Arthrobacter sp. M4]|uniref:signal peptidase I n=1 Tax=Arthrobacter sp. M4 TaxID=218160 RepID=UPI001CDB5921|nr:signal peptidase I [Arthrobacter sp. M4]MCA4134726.1 signal peptidase I [Arthrobacter sp. M4]
MTIAAPVADVPKDVDAPAVGKPAEGTRGTRVSTGAGRIVAKGLRFVARSIATALLMVAVASFIFLAIGPRIFGYQTSTMLTGSMSPLINPGDVVVTTRVPVSDLKVGDIVTFSIPVEDHRVETHRIIEVQSTPSGAAAIRTKGDANNGADPWTATLTELTIDRHAFTVPYLGTAIRALREPIVRTTLMYAAPTLLVAMLLVNIWKRPGRRPAEGTE